MVYDYFQNISIYKNLHKNFSLCIDFLKNNDLSKLKKGKEKLTCNYLNTNFGACNFPFVMGIINTL